MRFPVDRLIRGLKMGAAAKRGASAAVRVAVFADESASTFLIDTIREAFVPETTGGIVRVERLESADAAPKTDTDVSIVISKGSDMLQEAVQHMVIAGAPVVVVTERAGDVGFIGDDTPVLGLVAADDAERLLDALALWILDRTDKQAAFAANFPFMRRRASERIVRSAALANTLTGALVFLPGANFPVMTLAQIDMTLNLATVNGRPLRPERGYEIAAVVVAALGLRGIARLAGRRLPHLRWVSGALISGAGTYGIGRGLMVLYERDVDYSRANGLIGSLVRRVRAPRGDRRADEAVVEAAS